MSILKKIFGFAAGGITRREKPRVRVTDLHKTRFLVREPSEANVRVNSISAKGIGLKRTDLTDPSVEKILRGELSIDKKSYGLDCQVRHISNHAVGCQFIAPSDELVRAIDDFFKVEILALNLRAIDPATLKVDSRGEVTWYTAGAGNEIYLLLDRKGILEFHLSFLGNFLEGGRMKALRAGIISDENEVSDLNFAPRYKASEIVQGLSLPSQSLVGLAGSLVINTQAMSQNLQAELLGLLKQG